MEKGFEDLFCLFATLEDLALLPRVVVPLQPRSGAEREKVTKGRAPRKRPHNILRPQESA